MKMKPYRVVLILASVSFCSLSLANENQSLTITGQVVDYMARPVESAEVAVYEQFDDYSTGQDYTKLLDKIKKTDSNGNFVLNADINFWYRVFIVARKEGFALGWDVMASYIGERSENKYIILEKPCSLAGIVVDEKGEPAAGAKIRALPKTDYSERLEQRPVLAPEQWLTAQTDDKGHFQFDNFAADVSSDFWVEAPGWSSVYKYTTHWLKAYGFKTGRTDVHLVLPKEIPVQGRIIDAETGQPVAGAHVVIKPDNIREHKNPYCPHRTVSESDGKFYFKGIPPGKNSINASVTNETTGLVDKRIKVDIQADKDSKDIIVKLDKGGLIEIIAREEGTNEPASDIPIYFWQAEQDEKSNFYKDAITDKDGKLRIWAPPGECTFKACYDRNFFQTYEDQILVIKGQTAKSELIFDSIPSVSGLVLDQTNQPVSGVLVMANPVGEQGITDKDGRFEVRYSPSEPLERLVARDLTRNIAAIVEVKNDAKPIQITLKPALSIVGRITDPNSVGIPAARLELTLNVPGWFTYFGPEILTDFMGQYEIKALPLLQEGFGYRISVNSYGYGNKNYERISITGKPGTTMEIKPLVLQPADQSISGSVFDAEDKPVAGAVIFMRGKNQPIRRTITNSNGGFIIKRVCKGPLRIQANSDNSSEGDGFIKAEGGDQNVKIILGQDRIHTKHISLTGKQLPDFQDFNIDLSPADANEKMLLVCFWDMNQRPSRNCLLQLSKRAQELKIKDIVIIAVQASKVEVNALDKWVSENNIVFPLGMIQGNVEQTRLAWGIKSLPWLILTDSRHIVQAEGFALTELDEKLKSK
jgi:uncharacterized GH25 family protein/5-hydroxyisourate hydrolase-like protein (transthyretin family)